MKPKFPLSGQELPAGEPDAFELNGKGEPASIERTIINLFVELSDTKHNYSLHWSHFSEMLRSIIETNSYVLHFGPIYEIATSRGQPLKMHTAFVNYMGVKGNTRDYFIIAEDGDGKILGDRIQETLARVDHDYVASSGLIAVGDKGSGVAIPIELVTLDLLQREANTHGYPVKWGVYNANITHLSDLRHNYRRHRSPELAAKLEAAEEEQHRWQAVYGPKGKLGMRSAALVRELIPQGPPDNLEAINRIHLGRAEVNGIVYPKILSLETVGSVEAEIELRQKRFQEFMRLVSPEP